MIRFNFTIFWTLGAAANKRVFEGFQLKCVGGGGRFQRGVKFPGGFE